LISDFLDAKTSMVKNSKKAYNNTLSRFSDFMSHRNVEPIKARSGDIAAYLDQFTNRAYKTRTSYRKIINSYYNWCLDEGLISRNPVKSVVVKGNSKRQKQTNMTEDDFVLILNRCEGLRETTLVSFLWYTGVRSKELVEITVNDIDLDEESIYVSTSKTSNGNRYIPIHPNFLPLLTVYMEVRQSLDTDEDYLFLNKRGNQVIYRTLLHYVKKFQNNSKIDFSLHDFRRAFITRVYNATGDIVLCQQLAGHASIDTTRKYILGDNQRLEKFKAINF